ncbi:MAG: hypothetical protein NZU63_12630 [Gemmataceae bacterium]|nr:hypothetical protein [Gemmataceae bacterium]MDW8243248.1 hypothetical protein [Thermogemmata sp.]
MSYWTTLQLRTYSRSGDELDIGHVDGEHVEEVMKAIEKFIRAAGGGPFDWYDLDWYRELIVGHRQSFNYYRSTVEPILIHLSELYPDAVIVVRGLGEATDDMWLKEYRGGRVFVRELVKRWREEKREE